MYALTLNSTSERHSNTFVFSMKNCKAFMYGTYVFSVQNLSFGKKIFFKFNKDLKFCIFEEQNVILTLFSVLHSVFGKDTISNIENCLS